ncbi:hypothetical protein DXC04_06660 [Dorea sp. OM07-5]|nr:hypothetical protein DXC04_06660 [Dorea sp. OM07-5]
MFGIIISLSIFFAYSSYLFIPLFIGTGQSFQMTIFPLLVNSVYVSYNNIVKEKGNRAYI